MTQQLPIVLISVTILGPDKNEIFILRHNYLKLFLCCVSTQFRVTKAVNMKIFALKHFKC